MLPKKLKRLSDMQLIVLGFLLLILGGTCLLMLPCSSRTGEFTPFYHSTFYSNKCHLRHRSYSGRYLYTLVLLWTACIITFNPDRRSWLYYHRNCCFPGAAQENRSQRTRLDQGKFQCIRYRRRSTADQTCIKGNRTI